MRTQCEHHRDDVDDVKNKKSLSTFFLNNARESGHFYTETLFLYENSLIRDCSHKRATFD